MAEVVLHSFIFVTAKELNHILVTDHHKDYEFTIKMYFWIAKKQIFSKQLKFSGSYAEKKLYLIVILYYVLTICLWSNFWIKIFEFSSICNFIYFYTFTDLTHKFYLRTQLHYFIPLNQTFALS